MLLAAAAGTVMLGTLYPLALDALGLGKVSVGAPYFDAVFVPAIAPALFLMGVGPIARWQKASLPELAVRLRWAFSVSLVTALVLPLVLGRWSPLVSFGLALAAWIAATSAVSVWESVRQGATAAGAWRQFAGTPRAFHGMVLAHLGMAVLIVGVTVVKGYESQKDVRMEAGDTVEVGGYVFRFEGVSKVAGPNYVADRVTMQVTRNGKYVTTLYPSKRSYISQQKPMTEAAIDPGFTRDLYATLGDALSATAWLVRVQHKPFLSWIWGGVLLMALGGLLAASDRRYRLAARGWREEQQVTDTRGQRATPEVALQNAIQLTQQADRG